MRVDGTPSCDERALFPSKKLLCTFGYTGNLTPELEWITLGNSSWNASCDALNKSVECVFNSSCTGNKKSMNANSFMTTCFEENKTCEWGNS